jgi:GLPGLI family protein
MRWFLFTLMILLSATLTAQNNYTILYERTFNVLSDTSNSQYTFDQTRSSAYELSINGDIAYYKPYVPGKAIPKENPLGSKFSSHYIYKSLLDSTTIIGAFVDAGHFYRVKNNFSFKKWQLFPDTKTIAGYVCKKAVIQNVTYNGVAWYSPDIKTSFGSWMEDGLPGGP